MQNHTKPFQFEYRLANRVDGSFELRLTQSEFEDYQHLKTEVHKKLKAIGIEKMKPYWFEAPPTDQKTLEELRAAIGADKDAQLIAYYAHSRYERTYKPVQVGGVKYWYQSYSAGRFINFAPDLESDSIQTLSVFDGPAEYFDHGHIQTDQHASLFRTGDLKLPGQPPKTVGVAFHHFTYSAHFKRKDAIFQAFDHDKTFLGHYFASAFSSLVL